MPKFSLLSRLPRLPRLFGWLLVALISLLFIAAIAPQQIPVSLYKFSLVSMAGVMGYWLDRSLFPRARPSSYLDALAEDGLTLAGYNHCTVLIAACMLRRSVIVGCAMLSVGLGA